jgi:NTE family protein
VAANIGSRALWVLLAVSALSSSSLAQEKKVCVTLAGGVARGFAFLGALEELVTSGVPVNCLVGTSAGALVGGLYASGYSFETLEALLPRLQDQQGDLVRVLSPPINALLDPSGFEVLYRALVGGMRLEDTEPRLTVMATPLRVNTPSTAFTTGDLATAMRASISLPVIFPPVLIGDTYYADGGLRDPFPVNQARALGADVVIAIRALPQEGVKPDNLLNTLTLAVGAATTPVDQVQPDVWVRVKTYDTLYFDFSRVQELMQRGREAARALLPDVKRVLESQGIVLNPQGDPHALNAVNALWQERLEDGVIAARGLPRPFTVAPAIEFGPNSYDGGTLPNARGGFSSLGLGAEVSGGPLGRFSLGAGYANSLDSLEDAGFVRVGFNLAPWTFSARYDPTRQPVGAPWTLEAAFDVPGIAVRLGVDTNAFSTSSAVRFNLGALTLEPRLNLRFSYAPSLRLEASLGAAYAADPWLVRVRVLLGLTTGGASGFALGYPSLLRAYPANAVITPQAVIANLEFGYRVDVGNLGGLVSSAPELRVFADLGWGLDVNAGSSQFLWNLGVGLNVPGRWFGFLPFNFGFDVAFGPPGVRLNLFTILPLP